MLPGLIWLSLGALTAAAATAVNDWRYVVVFVVVTWLIPGDVLWPDGKE